jgi:hypothetical protein
MHVIEAAAADEAPVALPDETSDARRRRIINRVHRVARKGWSRSSLPRPFPPNADRRNDDKWLRFSALAAGVASGRQVASKSAVLPTSVL